MNQMSNEELRENFDFFDKDGNGKLSRDEFIGLMEALGETDHHQELALGFDAIDTDGSGLIEFSEFVNWFADR